MPEHFLPLAPTTTSEPTASCAKSSLNDATANRDRCEPPSSSRFGLSAKREALVSSIPNDFAVTGFDWLARWGEPTMDLLTTASQDFVGFGYHAAEFLLDHVKDEAESTPLQLLIPAPLVVRPSSTLRRRPGCFAKAPACPCPPPTVPQRINRNTLSFENL